MVSSSSRLAGKVFIGHGRAPAWTDLRDFLRDRLNLQPTEFNMEPVAGLSTKERLEGILAQSSFAFLVMTAEDEHPDGSLHARENVIHEAGLFQGRLGFDRAIILMEEGCSEFSNIVGLMQIRFPKGKILAVSEDIRKVLEERLTHVIDDLVTAELRFDYAPDPLTRHGWRPGYPDGAEPETGAYSVPMDSPVPACVAIKTARGYALDYNLPPMVCDGLSFEAQYSETTMVFTEVGLRSKDASLYARKWIKYYISSSRGDPMRSEITPGYPNEFTIWWHATALCRRWVCFNISLPEAVRNTWGKQEWTYDCVSRFRIRGSLSISPVRFTSSRAPVA